MSDFLKMEVEMGAVQGLFARMKKMQEVKQGLAAGAIHLKGKMAQYPAQRRGKAIWSSDPSKRRNQLRGFFAKLRAGEIQVPYRRGMAVGSQRLGQSWTSKAENGGMTQVIGTAVKYAPLVQAAKKQTEYHRLTGWQTEEQVMKKEGQHVKIVFNSYVRQMFK
jgi:hypothetical protein